MTWKRSLLASSLLTLGLVGALASIEGCSSKGDDATGTPEGACQAYAEASCNRSATCSKAFFAAYSSVAQCTTHVAAGCQAALALPDTGLTTDAVNACREATSGAGCVAATPAACADIHGARGEGRPCAEDIQCASGRCSGEGDLKCGSCAAVAAAGEACDSKKPCGYDLVCKVSTGAGGSGTTGAGTCVAKLQPGSTCTAADTCVSPYTCRNGTCSPPAGKGEPCSLGGGNACDSSQGLECQLGSGGAGGSGSMGICSEYSFKIAQPGEACGSTLQGTTFTQILCAGGGTCKQTGAGGSGTTTGTCQAALDIGSTCTGNAGTGGTSSSTSYPDGNCSGSAKCVNGTCQIPPYPTCN